MNAPIRTALAILLFVVAPAVHAAPAARPNFLVFVADDVDWRDYGCYGNDRIRTPAIDQLARRGLRFQSAVLTTPQCSPTRISILTGQYAHSVRAEDLHTPLAAKHSFLTAELAAAGYFTGHMLKTHYGPHGNDQFHWYSNKVGDLADFLAEAGDRPFFLWVGFRDAHRPYAPAAIDPPHDPADVLVPPYLVDTPETRADLALYYDEISRMDAHIGEMLATLEEAGRAENTCVTFLGDNGRPFPRAKGTLYDSGIGTPLVIAWPGVVPPGSVHYGQASVIDLAPTMLDAAGVDIPPQFQGRSMMPVLRDPTAQGRTHAFSERNWHDSDEHMRSVRTERYKLIRNSYLERPYGNPADLLRSPSWQSILAARRDHALTPAQAAVFIRPRPQLELYDLKTDPWETKNLAADLAHEDVLRRLIGVLDEWQRKTGDFAPEYRTRADIVDRETGRWLVPRPRQPPLENPLPDAAAQSDG